MCACAEIQKSSRRATAERARALKSVEILIYERVDELALAPPALPCVGPRLSEVVIDSSNCKLMRQHIHVLVIAQLYTDRTGDRLRKQARRLAIVRTEAHGSALL